jgi:hypothetical protein
MVSLTRVREKRRALPACGFLSGLDRIRSHVMVTFRYASGPNGDRNAHRWATTVEEPT